MVQLGKAKYWQSAAAAVETVAEDDVSAWLEWSKHAVLGATIYTCLKEAKYLSGFNLVVIDEASQVRVPEAAVPIQLMAKTGRAVLAGDHLQLPPIIVGVYPEAAPWRRCCTARSSRLSPARQVGAASRAAPEYAMMNKSLLDPGPARQVGAASRAAPDHAMMNKSWLGPSPARLAGPTSCIRCSRISA